AYTTAKRPDDARGLLEASIAAHKGRRSKALSGLYRALAKVELDEGDLSTGLEAMSKAFDMDLQNGDLAMALGLLARDLDDQELATRAFRSITLMKGATAGSSEGSTPAAKAVAYYHLGQIAREKGDVKKARLMVEKAVAEDPGHAPAREMLEELRAG